MTDQQAASASPETPGDCTELAGQWLEDLFARWVKDLDLRVDNAQDGTATLTLPFSDNLCRSGGTICGQALMAAADTAMVLAIGSLFGEVRPTTTVTLNTSFLRPVASGDVSVICEITKPGRRLMFGEVRLQGADGKTAAHVTTTYAML